MKKIKFKVSIDADNPEHVRAARTFLDTLVSATLPIAEEPKQTIATKASVTKAAAKKAAASPTPQPPRGIIEPSHTIDDVRLLVSEKAKIDRDAVKAKLVELGADNVTDLDSSKYGEFVKFLKTI